MELIPMADAGKNLPALIAEKIAGLRALIDVYIKLTYLILVPASGAWYATDSAIIGVTQRSIALIQGFTLMVEDHNALCALGILRMQIDTLMRLFAFKLVDDRNSLLTHLLADKPLSKLRSHDGRPLTDAYLHEQLSQYYPWVSTVYGETSGFVHFSGRHITSPIIALDEDERIVEFLIRKEGPPWSEEDMAEAVSAFVAATDAVIQLCQNWLAEKRRYSTDDAGGLIPESH
jgi:hypothetical protein